MMYIKSTLTQQVYEVECLPQYMNGYEVVRQEDYNKQQARLNQTITITR